MNNRICSVDGCQNKRALISKGYYRRVCQKHHKESLTYNCPHCFKEFKLKDVKKKVKED